MNYNPLSGSQLNLQGGGSLQGTLSPMNNYNPVTPAPAPQPKPVVKPVVKPKTTPVLKPVTQVNDLSGTYGMNNGTVYNKSTGRAFATPDEFFSESGVKSFDGAKFDTNYSPLPQAPAPQQAPKLNDFSQFKDTTTPEQFLASAANISSAQQEAANEQARLFQNYMNAARNQAELSPEEKKAKEDLLKLQENARLGVSNLEGQGRGITLGLVRGQQGKLLDQAGIQEQTLQQRLANVMAENEAKRKAQLSTAELEYNFAKQKAEGQKPIEVSAGSSLIRLNPATGKYEQAYSAPQAPKTEVVNGELVKVNPDGTVTKLYGSPTAPKQDTSLTEVNGQRVLVNNQTGQIISVLGRSNEGSTGSALTDLNMQLKMLQLQQAQQNLNAGTPTQQSVAVYANRITNANNILNSLESQIARQGVIGQTYQGVVPNFMKSDTTQSFEQAKRDFATAVLRKESGASISPTEFSTFDQQYFPQAGDSPQTIQQKKVNRQIVADTLKQQAGNAYTPPVGVPINTNSGSIPVSNQPDPLGLFR